MFCARAEDEENLVAYWKVCDPFMCEPQTLSWYLVELNMQRVFREDRFVVKRVMFDIIKFGSFGQFRKEDSAVKKKSACK